MPPYIYLTVFIPYVLYQNFLLASCNTPLIGLILSDKFIGNWVNYIWSNKIWFFQCYISLLLNVYKGILFLFPFSFIIFLSTASEIRFSLITSSCFFLLTTLKISFEFSDVLGLFIIFLFLLLNFLLIICSLESLF